MEEDNRKFFEELSSKSDEPAPEAEAEFAKSTPSISGGEESAVEIPVEDEGQLTIDVYQTDKQVIVESPIAGVKEEDIDVQITSDTVTITGKREREREIKEDDYIYQECYWGRFSRSVVLPTEVDADKADASIKNGVLTVKLPKLDRLKAKKVKVKKTE